jgi:hypothetical protein
MVLFITAAVINSNLGIFLVYLMTLKVAQMMGSVVNNDLERDVEGSGHILFQGTHKGPQSG